MKTYTLHRPQSESKFPINRKLEGRKAIDVLSGLCLGLLADGKINSREADFLRDWISLHASFLPHFVVEKLIPTLGVLRSGAEAPPELLQELTTQLYALVGLEEIPSENNHSELASSAGRPCQLIFDVVNETISFLNIEVVVTGKFENISRGEVINHLLRMGALPRDAMPTNNRELPFTRNLLNFRGLWHVKCLIIDHG